MWFQSKFPTNKFTSQCKNIAWACLVPYNTYVCIVVVNSVVVITVLKLSGPKEKKPNRQTTYIIGWLIKGMPFWTTHNLFSKQNILHDHEEAIQILEQIK